MKRRQTIWISRTAIEKAAQAIYRHAGWDRKWSEIAPEGRKRFRKAAADAIFTAIPMAVRQIGLRR